MDLEGVYKKTMGKIQSTNNNTVSVRLFRVGNQSFKLETAIEFRNRKVDAFKIGDSYFSFRNSITSITTLSKK